MNFVIILYDTLRYDYVGVNGARPVRTPNWDRFAEAAWNFTRCYAGSYPSLPHRCDCATGRFVYPFYGWQNLPEQEVHLVQKLTDKGWQTHLIADSTLPLEGGLARGFRTCELIESELEPDRLDRTPLPCQPQKSRMPEQLRRMWALRSQLLESGDERDWPQARVMQAAAEWIQQRRRGEPFLLWVESWRIHEPWIDPPRYVEEYDGGYAGEWVALPSYQTDLSYLTREELNHIRAMYAAAVTFSDKWFGDFVARLEAELVLDDTAVIVTSDHGWSLGEHNRTGKHGVPVPPQNVWPLYEECVHVPLLIRLPGQIRARRSSALVQHADLLPTVLDYAGIDPGPTAKGVSWRRLLEGKPDRTRDLAVTCAGMGEYPKSGSGRITLTSADYSLILPTPTQPAELYHLGLDPHQTTNLFSRHRSIARDLHRRFLELVDELGIEANKRRTWENVLQDPRLPNGG